MSNRYTADGKRRSSMTHARRGHACNFCDVTSFGNGGKVAHGRAHARRGEAVELFREYEYGGISRMFLAPDDPMMSHLLSRGHERVPN